jgi:hypothetical protein
LGGDELTARATAFGGGEPALAWHRRSDLMGDAAKASRCIALASASWDLSTAVAMGPNPNEGGEEICGRKEEKTMG